jgi:hypothetical protein
VAISPDQAVEHARLANELAQVGFVLPGSLTERRQRCTHAGCHCHDEPPLLHGPYFQWSRKVAAKTVSKTLSAEQVEEYRPWLDNDRRLHAVVRELEALALSVLESDPRTPRRS